LLVFFSAAFFDHAYYMVTFAPAICALVGIGSVALYRAYQARTGWQSWLWPLALVVTALIQCSILLVFPALNRVLAPIILDLSVLLAIVLVVGLFVARFPRAALGRPFFLLGFALLLLAPTVWAIVPATVGADTVDPTAGPISAAQLKNPLTLIAHVLVPESAHADPALEQYLSVHQGQARYLVAAMNAPTAAPFILDTGKPVIAYGGYTGFDPILTAQQVATLVQQGEVRFFLLPVFSPIQLNTVSPTARKDLETLLPHNATETLTVQPQPALSKWITSHCSLVPRAIAEPGSSGPANTVNLGEGITVPTRLYDCSHS
jgi:4-amino-4-deoxy-L-arabinose transferase-like glycosyltransferase